MRGKVAFAGNIDQQNNFAVVTLQADLLAVDGSQVEVVDALRLGRKAGTGDTQHQDQNQFVRGTSPKKAIFNREVKN